MNMNTANVHTPHNIVVSKSSRLLVAGVVVSSLLTACGGSSGPSAEELAAQAAAAAQVAADKAAADKAAADKAAQAAAERDAALAAARKQVSDTVATLDTDTKAAQSASSLAGYALLQAKQQAANYPEVAETLAKTQAFADQAEQAAKQALAQKALVTTAASNADGAQTLEAVTVFVQQAKNAALSAKQARAAAEQALDATRQAATQVSADIKLAESAKRFSKLDSAGNILPANATSWACVQENATGKVWESKTNDNGLRDSDWRYRHFHNSAGYAGTRDSTGQILCQGLGNCDAYSYVNAVSNTGLCGRSQWRLPTMEELLSLVQINENGQRPNIDLKFFPDTVNKPNQAAYCSENLAKTATDCGPNYTNPHYQPDGRIECNYQGVDYGLPITAENPRGGSMAALRHYGEVQDGLPTYPTNNWICYTRLISNR
jgi:chemotaxis protein histidine kinase CheA